MSKDQVTGTEACERGRDGKRGIALVICLGMLGVMMVLAVSFAISMRAERVAAGHYLEVARARQLVHGALARALWDIEGDLARAGSEAYPVAWGMRAMAENFTNAVDLHVGDVEALLPRRVVRSQPRGVLETVGQLASRGTNVSPDEYFVLDSNAIWEADSLKPWTSIVEGVGRTGIHIGYIDDWDPGTLSGNEEQRLWAKDEGGARVPWRRGWYRLVEPAAPQWWPVKGVGRYSYLVVNVSGLLDGNRSGQGREEDPRGREPGGKAEHIVLSQLPDIGSSVRAAQFVSSRGADPWYETLYDMDQNSVFGDPDDPESFFPYQRYAVEVDGALPADVGGTGGDIVARTTSDIKMAFRRAASQSSPGLEEALYYNLVDYVDDDNLPGNADGGARTDGPFVEAIPMVNEVRATNSFSTSAAGSLSGQLRVEVEYAFPFVYSRGDTFTLESTATITDPAGITFTPQTPEPLTETRSLGANQYYPQRHIFRMQGSNNPAQSIQFTVTVDAHVLDGGDEVDKIPRQTLRVRIPPVANGSPGGGGDGHDVVDPRLNWHATHWANSGPWPYIPSIGQPNVSAWRYLTNNVGVCDGDFEMYVANAPMQTVGELGNLFSPGVRYAVFPPTLRPAPGVTPWRTLRLYDHGNGEWDKVYDHFTLRGYTNSFKGRLNPNTEVRDALASVFFRMPVNKYPDQNPSTPNGGLSWSAASEVAALIQDHTFTNQLLRLSDMGRPELFAGISNLVLSASPTSLQRESIYRNSGDLLHPRQNLFLILLAAQTAQDPYKEGLTKADQRAVALVWRDPLADSTGHHSCYIRWFSWVKK